MKIWEKEILNKFAIKHASISNSLQYWIEFVEEADWKSHNEIKRDFPSADYIGNGQYVFNIQGNNFRVVANVVFASGILKIRYIGTHADYDKKSKII
ncbi:MAG: type II toxin-antitoxin system HigB family toxin [Tannerella sp.]|jgi:mRNA interferase HigB|nr:type II toxin-antitoxin system HigB family toxin [Tannerella sp.]